MQPGGLDPAVANADRTDAHAGHTAAASKPEAVDMRERPSGLTTRLLGRPYANVCDDARNAGGHR